MTRHLLVAGVRQKTAPIEVREQFALNEEELEQAISLLCKLPGIEECAILTTCNRTEIYTAVTQTELALQSIRQFFKTFKNAQVEASQQNLFVLLHEDAALHLFRVASGLDSLIIGEGQILAQVKDTLSTAQRLNSAGTLIDKLFKTALSIGKMVRSETGVAQKDLSVSRAAYEFALAQKPNLLNQTIAIVGGGKMAELVMTSLKRDMTPAQQQNVILINRSPNRLDDLTQKYGFKGETWEKMTQVFQQVEVIFVATGAPHVVFEVDHFREVNQALIIDIAVPRNVSPQVANLPGIQLFNTDNLVGISDFNAETQTQLMEQAQAIIEREYAHFYQWMITLPVIPTLALLRAKIETMRQAEVAAVCPDTDQTHDLMELLSKNLMNKILHDPTVRLKATQNLEAIYQQAAILSHLFNIESPIPHHGDDPTIPQFGLSLG